MTEYHIDDWGFLRRDGKIVGWTPADFIWAMHSRIRRAMEGSTNDNR